MIEDKYLEIYKHEKIPLWDLFVLIFIHEGKTEFVQAVYESDFMAFNRTIQFFEQKGYIKQTGSFATNVTMRKAGKDLFEKYTDYVSETAIKSESPKEQLKPALWIDSWRELFPEGSNSAGFRYRGDRADVLNKMIKFVKDHHEYTIEEIFQATKTYVDKFSLTGYAYMQQAHYFIHKRGVGSTLSSECEGLAERSDTKQKGKEYGRSII